MVNSPTSIYPIYWYSRVNWEVPLESLMIRKIFIVLFFKVNPFCFSQEYSVEILGISIAEIRQTLSRDSIIYRIETDGLTDLFYPIENTYYSIFDPENYGIIKFSKKVNERDLKTKMSAIKDSLNFFNYTNSETVKLNINTKTIFTLLSMIQNLSFSELDTKWFDFEHESQTGKARFLWADSSNVWDGKDSIFCDHYRLDIEIMENDNQNFKETDIFMENIVKEEVTREFWVSKRKPKRIIQAKIKNKSFPLPLFIEIKSK